MKKTFNFLFWFLTNSLLKNFIFIFQENFFFYFYFTIAPIQDITPSDHNIKVVVDNEPQEVQYAVPQPLAAHSWNKQEYTTIHDPTPGPSSQPDYTLGEDSPDSPEVFQSILPQQVQSKIDDIAEEWSKYAIQPELSTDSELEGIIVHLPEEDTESLCDTEVVYFMGEEDTFLGTATPPQGVTPTLPSKSFIHLSPPNLEDLQGPITARFSPTDLVKGITSEWQGNGHHQ